jgi:hypothetical protein
MPLLQLLQHHLQVPEACTFRIQVTHSNTDLFADDLFARADDGDGSWTAVGTTVAIQQQQQRRGSSSKGKVRVVNCAVTHYGFTNAIASATVTSTTPALALVALLPTLLLLP